MPRLCVGLVGGLPLVCGEAGRCCGKGKKPQQGNPAPPRNLVLWDFGEQSYLQQCGNPDEWPVCSDASQRDASK